MAMTVFAEGLGLFHKGSGGTSVAPGDVCLTPPPPPAGPVPIPYVNMASAADLAKGSVATTIDGEPTALEDASEIATSTGNEAATQGGGVITHKTKGKAAFTSWSFSVFIEGKGVCCHGHMLGQNSASTPVSCICAAACTKMHKEHGKKKPRCNPADQPDHPGTTDAQKASVAKGPCYQCGKRKGPFIPDHQPPLKIAWMLGGCHIAPKEEGLGFLVWAKSDAAIRKKPILYAHCGSCSPSQGGLVSHLTQDDVFAMLKADDWYRVGRQQMSNYLRNRSR